MPTLVTLRRRGRQADAICRRVLEQRERGTPLQRAGRAVPRRLTTATGSRSSCSRRNIPFVKCGGLKFLEAAHVKDVLAMLRVLENPRDEVAWFRVLQLLGRHGPGERAGP